MKLKLNFFIFLMTLNISASFGQVLDSISTSLQDGIVVVRFDFLDGEPEVDYELYLYGSHDNFQKPLQETTGDVGKGIRTGVGKVIYWNAEKELGNFKGDFSLRIKGQKYFPIVEFKNISSQLKLKRGEQYNFQWKSNIKSDRLMMTIKRNGVPVTEPSLVENTGDFLWFIPKDLKPSRDITLEIADPENLLRKETSPPFVIKRKVPLTVKIIPAVAAMGGAAFYFMNKQEDDNIPAPPEVPNVN